MHLSRNIRQAGNMAVWVLAIILVIALMAAGAYGTYAWQQRTINRLNRDISSLKIQQVPTSPEPTQNQTSPQLVGAEYTSLKGVKVVVYTPIKNATMVSPVAVLGEVPGNWSFEATFPVLLKDASGGVVAQGSAQVLSDAMTDQLVLFSAKLIYSGTPTGSGTLVLQKDNPSGEAQNADSVSIPVEFKQTP